MKKLIMVVEDDASIRLGLEEILRGEGFEVAVAKRGDEALSAIAAKKPSLVILDVMLPGQSGFDICKQLRAQKNNTPVLMLSAKGQEIDKVVGLGLGADDYLTKPFGVQELIARVNALLRRSSGASAATNDDSFKIGPATIDPKLFQIRRGKTTEDLTPKELKLLQFFHAHPNEPLSRDRLLNQVWGCNYYGTTRTLDQVIVQLRKKLGDASGEHIVTVHGVGYKCLTRF